METIRLETADLVLAEVEDADLDAVVAVRQSNPERLARTEGTEAGPGDYDRGMLERDLMVVAFDPARHALGARVRSTGRLVAYADLLDAHPDDGIPCLGVVEIARSDQGRGYGRQIVEAVAGRAAGELGGTVIRSFADAEDDDAVPFLGRVGFTPVARTERSSPRGRVSVTVFERPLSPD